MTFGAGVDTVLASGSDIEEIGKFLVELGGPHFGERFPGKTAADFYRWKYLENPLGPALIGAAVAGSRIVSVAAAVPKTIWCDGESRLVYELGDFLTASTHRKQGLFSALIELVCGEAASRQAILAYVRPNENSFPILRSRLGFEELRQFASRRFVLPSLALGRRIGGGTFWRAIGVDRIAQWRCIPRGAGGVECRRVDDFRDLDRSALPGAPAFRLALRRDRRYLDWRYAAGPTPYRIWMAYRNGEVAGYAVTFSHRAEPVAFIADLFTAPEDAPAARALLAAAIGELLETGAAMVYTWTLTQSVESAAHQALARACPHRDRLPMRFAVRFLSPGWNAGRLPGDRWHFAPGDFDGI